jgi:3-deoxy-manno-octulosonate cytidylyltransferase (CMP-KDO synthetase)
MGSKRFPNKPMAEIKGKKLLYRTWSIASSIQNVDKVYIATADEEIRDLAQNFNAEVIMTSPDCENGTMRTFDAALKLKEKPNIIVNLQGDAVLTPPFVLEALINAMKHDPSINVATPATLLTHAQYKIFADSKLSGVASGTSVVFDKNYDALYFSKNVIPFIRKTNNNPEVYRHIGTYAYRYNSLQQYAELAPTRLERIEELEQLRYLENNIKIRIVLVDYQGRSHWSIDNPEDVKIAEDIIEKEGELLEWS